MSPPPKNQPPSKPPEPTFTASTTYFLRASPIDKLNVLVTRLAESGLLNIRSVSYKVEQERQALNRARRAAMADAKEQAAAYADAGDFWLVDIAEVTDGEARAAVDVQNDLPSRGRPFVQIIPPATVTFTASVNVTWRIAPKWSVAVSLRRPSST